MQKKETSKVILSGIAAYAIAVINIIWEYYFWSTKYYFIVQILITLAWFVPIVICVHYGKLYNQKYKWVWLSIPINFWSFFKFVFLLLGWFTVGFAP